MGHPAVAMPNLLVSFQLRLQALLEAFSQRLLSSDIKALDKLCLSSRGFGLSAAPVTNIPSLVLH